MTPFENCLNLAIAQSIVATICFTGGEPQGAPSRKNGEDNGNDDDMMIMYMETTQVWSGSCDLGA